MKITVSKIKRELSLNYGWHNINATSSKSLSDEIIKDTLNIINKILKEQKGISIK